MKVIQCEMCGSRDLLKQDGVFVCQACGTKYSVEEAKKMMVEGTVQVAGTVKVDKSEELKNLYILAERARKSNNSDNAVLYYNQIIEKDPNSWQANFYSIYFKAKNTNVGSIPGVCYDLINCYESTLELLIQEKGNDITEELSMLLEDIYNYSNTIVNSTWGMHDDCKYQGHALEILSKFGDKLIESYGETYQDIAVDSWRKTMQLYQYILNKYGVGWDSHAYVLSFSYDINAVQSKLNSHSNKLAKDEASQNTGDIECPEELKNKINEFVRMTQESPENSGALDIRNGNGDWLIELLYGNNGYDIIVVNDNDVLLQENAQKILREIFPSFLVKIDEGDEWFEESIDNDVNKMQQIIVRILNDIYYVDCNTVSVEISRESEGNNGEKIKLWIAVLFFGAGAFLGLFMGGTDGILVMIGCIAMVVMGIVKLLF